MYHHASPYILDGSQSAAANILADSIAHSPETFALSDYSLFTTMFWHDRPGTVEARHHFLNKLHEEVTELDAELEAGNVDRKRVVEEFGDVSFCSFALGNAFGLDMTIFAKDLWARRGYTDIECRGDRQGPPLVQSIEHSATVQGHTPVRYGFTILHQPYDYVFEPGETYQDYRANQLGLIGHVIESPPSRTRQELVGYTLVDIWLGEARRAAEIAGTTIFTEAFADNMPKLLNRVQSARQAD